MEMFSMVLVAMFCAVARQCFFFLYRPLIPLFSHGLRASHKAATA
jgi:hypothetical protein